MAADTPARFPSLPPSVAEWEDLLVRMEIMQRVLRNTLEPVAPGDAGASEELTLMLDREVRVGRWLERVSTGASEGDPDAGDAMAREPDLGARADRFVSLRARNFAMLQRRGLEVWRWTADFAAYGPVSAYQLITWLVAQDVRSLAALRERASTGADAC